MKTIDDLYRLYGIFVLGLATLFLTAVYTSFCLMFQHSFYMIFGKDLPWYFDILGGFILNGLNFCIWIVCLLAKAFGVETPFIN
jgi:hypothetical protein